MDIEKLEEIIIFCKDFKKYDNSYTTTKVKYFAESSGVPIEKIAKIVVMLRGIVSNNESLVNDLERRNAKLMDEIIEKERRLSLVSEDLEALKTNAEKAFSNYKNLTDQLLSSKNKALLEVEDIDRKLSAAGVLVTTESKGILGTFIAIVFSVALAVFLIYMSYIIGGVEPTSNIEVSYDLGKMVEAFLLGSGALIAGVAYAFSVLKSKGKEL